MIERIFFFINYNVAKPVQWLIIISLLGGAAYYVESIVPPSIKSDYMASVQSRYYNFSKYMHYTFRDYHYSNTDGSHIVTPVHRTWANIDGMTSEGKVVLRLYGEDGITRLQAELSDLDIIDYVAAAELINRHARKQVKVDYYQYEVDGILHDSVVIWIDDTPINQALVEIGSANPLETPPTNIVNEMMRSYYWSKL